jgi:hypothetical protein
VSFHTNSLPEDRCVHLVKKLGRRMPEDVIQDKWGDCICVQGVLQFRSGRRDQETAVCQSRWKRTFPRNDCCIASAVHASAIRSGTAATNPGVFLVVRLTSHPPHSSSLSTAAVEENKRPTTGLRETERG